MANHKSALKRIRQNEKRRQRNRYWRSTMRSTVRNAREAVSAGNRETAQAALQQAVQTIGKVASKGVIHKRQASRRISRLQSLFNKSFS